MINNVVLVGRLTRDPELRYTPSNVAVATFSLAVNRNFKNQAGDREADFISCIMWRQQAENFANWCKKGNLVGITGRIQTRSYENQQGQRVYVTEVVAESFQTLEKKDNSANQSSMENQMPPSFGTSDPMDISDDDFPFQVIYMNDDLKKQLIEGYKREIEKAESHISVLTEPCVKSLAHSRAEERSFWKKRVKEFKRKIKELEDER